jgi:MFS family permease
VTAVSGRRPRLASPRTASILAACVLVLVAALPVLGVLSGHAPGSVTAVISLLVVVVVLAAVGLVVARHQPGNVIGWLMLGAAAWIPLTIAASEYAALVYDYGHRGIAGLGPVAVVLSGLFTFVIVVFPLVTLVFPDGRLPSPGWRWVLWAYLVLVLILPVSYVAATAAAGTGHHLVYLPSGQVGAADAPPSWTALVFFATVALAWLGALGHQIASWRRSSGERRQQLKWLLSGTVACAVLGIWALATNSAIWEVAILGLCALPASMGVAILRYRLYDIDRIISRTLAYATVTGLLIGMYAGLVLLATQVLGFASTWAVAASTLAAAALFTPVRRRVQKVVDRRFNRARYDADAAVAAFAGRLQDAVDLDAVRADLLASVRAALEPAHVSVWLDRPPAVNGSRGERPAR